MPLYQSLVLMFLSVAAAACTTHTNKTNDTTLLTEQNAYFERLKTQKVSSDNIVQWKNIGPGMSGYNEELWTHPTNPNVMFIGPDMHVSYGTWDGGESWQSLKDVDEQGQLMKRVLDITFSHQDPNFALALDWNGWVYHSSNQGRTWDKLAELSPSYKDLGYDPYAPEAFKQGWYDEQLAARLSSLSVDPTNDSIWYIGAGDFWNVKENHRSAKSPWGRRLSYADYGYILKSKDRGRTWAKITDGLDENIDVGKIIVNPLSPRKLVMLSSHGLLSSSDAGLSWVNTAKGLPNNIPRDLTSYYDQKTGTFILYLVEQTVYEVHGQTVKSRGGVYKSIDGGLNWNNVSGNLAIDLNELHYPYEIDRYYRTIANWFGLSQEQAKSNSPQLPHTILPVFNRIVVNPNNSKEIYLTYNKKHDRTFGPGEVWRSLDGGNHWTVVARHGAYWHAKKDTAYWESRNNDLGANVEFAHLQHYMDVKYEVSGNRLLSINSSGTLFISIDQQTHQSSDKGQSWQQIDDIETYPNSNVWIGRGNSDLPGRFMLLETGIPNRRLLTSGEHGLWQTVPVNNLPNKQALALKQIEGQNNIDGMVSISTVAVHPNDPNSLYILGWRQDHRGKLRRSTDGGETWENIATVLETSDALTHPESMTVSGAVIQGPPGMLPAQNSLLIDPIHPNNMYFAATRNAFSEIYRAPRREPTKGDFGFFKSNDGGFTWKVSNNGFHHNFSLRRLALDPDNPSTIYAATSDKNGGLYVSKNGGDTWERLILPSNVKSVNNIFIDRHTKEMFISTGYYYNGNYEEGGAWRSQDKGKTWSILFKASVVLQVETSPVNADIIVLTVGNQMRTDRDFLNPGVYLSLNNGKAWKKINKNLSNYDKIIDAKPDPYDENLIWAAGWGSGWFIGYIIDAATEQ